MDRSRLVYSSEFGRACPDCGRPLDQCSCPRKPAREKGDGIVRVRRESKGRGGKTVISVTGLPLDDGELDTLTAELKRRLGTGGAAKDGEREDSRDERSHSRLPGSSSPHGTAPGRVREATSSG